MRVKTLPRTEPWEATLFSLRRLWEDMPFGAINFRGSVVLWMGFLIAGTSGFGLAPCSPILTQTRIGLAFACPFKHGVPSRKPENIQRSLTCLHHQPIFLGRRSGLRQTGIIHDLPKRFFKTGSSASSQKFLILHAHESPDSAGPLQEEIEAIIESAEWRAGEPVRHNTKASFLLEAPYQVCRAKKIHTAFCFCATTMQLRPSSADHKSSGNVSCQHTFPSYSL